MKFLKISLLLLLFLSFVEAKPFVTAKMRGQLGNNMFTVAAASALAWDHDADPYFSELQTVADGGTKNMFMNLEHIFFRCTLFQPPEKARSLWKETQYPFQKIPYCENLCIDGYFQSEKYFAHHREKILQLFAPHPEDLAYIQKKYRWVLDHPNTVGVQIRRYLEDPQGMRFIQYGKDYLRKAMSRFPKKTLFVVSSNDIPFAKANIPEEFLDKVFYIEKEPHYIDLHLLSLCNHNVISNSSFGWWAAWLNRHSDKIVIVPERWFNPPEEFDTKDLIPNGWVAIPAKWGPVSQPATYQ